MSRTEWQTAQRDSAPKLLICLLASYSAWFMALDLGAEKNRSSARFGSASQVHYAVAAYRKCLTISSADTTLQWAFHILTLVATVLIRQFTVDSRGGRIELELNLPAPRDLPGKSACHWWPLPQPDASS